MKMLSHCPVVLMMLFMSVSLTAQEDIESMYLRKAVKDFVARDYESAAGNLEQVLTVNPQNEKARKLMAKVYVRKGEQALAANNVANAASLYASALEYDGANAEALKGAAVASQRQEAASQAAAARAAEAAQERLAAQQAQMPATAQPYLPAAPTIIQTGPATSTYADSAQAKAFESLISVMNQNQKIIAQQIEQSNQLVSKTDETKDKYLDALLNASRQSNDRIMRYILIGGGVAVVFLVIFAVVFFFFFYSVNRSAELRTIQATQQVAALLAAPQGQGGPSPLLLTGPSQPDGSGGDAVAAPAAGGQANVQQAQPVTGVTESGDIGQLNDSDPIKRAAAVEAVEAEIIESRDSVRFDKIKKLGELLKDENNRVRANAAKAIYEVDKEASISTLSAMLKDSSKRMRASAVWALGEISSEDALELLLSIDNETDEMITYNIKMALEKIKHAKRFHLSADQEQKVDVVIEKYKEMV